jgi:hypothetical protein
MRASRLLPTTRVGVLPWILLSFGCGDDVSLSVRFSSGIVSETAQCRGNGGEFPLRQQDGLTVVIIISERTTIVRADFSPAACTDVIEGERASVRGSDDQGHIQADEVELLGS